MTMRLLEAERAVLARYLPKLACGLDQLPLEERERCGGGAIELFRRSGGPGLLIPRENKGHGISARDAVRIQRAVGASSPSLAVATTMHHFSVASLLETSRVSQGLEWMLLEAIATCNKIVASGFAEGVRGQSVLRPALCGRRQGGTYILNGTKRPCSLAYSMDLLTASVLLDDDVPGVAVVPAHSKGIRIEPFWSAPVLRGAESDAVVLEDVVVDEAMVVAVGSIDGSAMDSVQAAGFLWFELLMTSSYLGMASALVERTLEESRGSASERSALAGQLEASAAALEMVAHDLDTAGPDAALLTRALLVRYASQDRIGEVVNGAVELLGGMSFIRGPFVHLFAGSTRCLGFHPPSRGRSAEALTDSLKGAPLLLG